MDGQAKMLFVDNSVDSFYSYRMQLVRAARDMGFEVHIACPPGDSASKIVGEGFPFHDIPMGRKGTSLPHETATILALYRLYRRLRPSLVHHLRLKPVVYGSIAASAARVPAIVNTLTGLGHLFTDQSPKTILLREWVKKGCRHVFRYPHLRVIFQNPDDRAIFIREEIISGHQAIVIKGSGVDVCFFRPSPEPPGPPVVILASRMLWDKGVGQFVTAGQILRSEGAHCRIALVGNSDPENPAAIPPQQLQAWNDTGAIEWWGFHTDMAAVLSKVHIVCLPSFREGIPRILIEAAAAGRPIITTDAPGCRELVRPGENGLIVPARDTAALVIALRMLIENADLRKSMGRRNREIAVQDFAMELVISQVTDVYRNVLGNCAKEIAPFVLLPGHQAIKAPVTELEPFSGATRSLREVH